jgi:tetratricopeptide (TPR) repeat protein
MKNKIFYRPLFMILSAIFLIINGCSDDFFDQKAGDRITPDKHYQSIIDAQVSLLGAMVPLQDIMPRLILLDGLRSDMMVVTNNAGAHLNDINEQVFSKDNPYTDPADLYKVIININEVLANIDQVGEVDRNFDALISFIVKGGLYSMRAWTYLTIARIYNKAAYIEDNLTSIPDNLNQNVIEKDVLIDTLINQLLPYVEFDSETEFVEGKVQYYVNVKALLGELYLEKGEYATAAEYLKLACESYGDDRSLLKVDQSYRDNAWSSIHLNAESSVLENLSVVPFSSVEDQFNYLAAWVGHDFDFMVKPSKILVDSFMSQVDAAGKIGDQYRGMGVTFSLDTLGLIRDTTYETEPYITKYEIDKADPFSSDIIISRAADIHLLLAEALNRMGDETSQEYALMLLNQGVNKENPKPPQYTRWASNLGIRGRVYLAPREIPEGMSSDSVTLLIEDFIIAERAMELAYEGKRWFDLVRIAERRNQPEYLADKVAAKFAGTPKYEMIRNKLMNPENWYLPF